MNIIKNHINLLSTLCAFQCYNLIIFEQMNEKIHAKLCLAVPNIHTFLMGSVKLLPLKKFKGFLIGIYTIVQRCRFKFLCLATDWSSQKVVSSWMEEGQF